ncbi:uncharacterized protein LOC113347541 [Papaver somniferum]|uniref:uncharacterized protein LOC113347541 n=1 Tax=Papaver somniferum TaxID=3469 RepID=UPI000E6F4BF6|nr:uncharacterized protein LOC113347541 [Papaver somniferum]
MDTPSYTHEIDEKDNDRAMDGLQDRALLLKRGTDFLRHAHTTSARPPFGKTGKVYLKSPLITTVMPPIGIEHTMSSFISIGILNVECAVLPPTKINEAIPDDATVSITSPLNRQLAAIVLYTNFFPVPALPLRKKENVLASCRIRAVVCPTGCNSPSTVFRSSKEFAPGTTINSNLRRPLDSCHRMDRAPYTSLLY